MKKAGYWQMGNNFASIATIALADKEQFKMLAGKIAFAETADLLGLSTPKWEYVKDADFILLDYPYWLKADYGTAGRSVYKISSKKDLAEVTSKLTASDEEWMVQQDIVGDYGQVQAVFDQWRITAVHSSVKAGSGAGGSAAARLSIESKKNERAY